MNYGWTSSVQEMQSFEDLATPIGKHFGRDFAKPTDVPTNINSIIKILVCVARNL